MSNLEIAKKIIKENIKDADCGLFDCRNIMGDPMNTIYHKDGLVVDICYKYSYFEVFGLTDDEFSELLEYYNSFPERDFIRNF